MSWKWRLVDQAVGGAEVATPRQHEQREQRERAEPAAHEEPPAVQRALEVQREPHRQVPRRAPTSRSRTAATMKTASLPCSECVEWISRRSSPKPSRMRARKPRAHFAPHSGHAPDVEAHRRVDVPRADSSVISAEDDQMSRIVRNAALKYSRLLRRPDSRSCVHGKTWFFPTKSVSSRKHERDRQEGDVAFHEPDDGARPARRRDALHGDEHDAGRRERGEEQPVDVERAPGAIGRDEQHRAMKTMRADDRERQRTVVLSAVGIGLRRRGEDLLARAEREADAGSRLVVSGVVVVGSRLARAVSAAAESARRRRRRGSPSAGARPAPGLRTDRVVIRRRTRRADLRWRPAPCRPSRPAVRPCPAATAILALQRRGRSSRCPSDPALRCGCTSASGRDRCGSCRRCSRRCSRSPASPRRRSDRRNMPYFVDRRHRPCPAEPWQTAQLIWK